jgi:hypothetical protein
MHILLKSMHLTTSIGYFSISLMEAFHLVPDTNHELDRRTVIPALTECQRLSDSPAETAFCKGAYQSSESLSEEESNHMVLLRQS